MDHEVGYDAVKDNVVVVATLSKRCEILASLVAKRQISIIGSRRWVTDLWCVVMVELHCNGTLGLNVSDNSGNRTSKPSIP